MIAVLMSCLFLCNTCARAELRKQERVRKLCSATLIYPLTLQILDQIFHNPIYADNIQYTQLYCIITLPEMPSDLSHTAVQSQWHRWLPAVASEHFAEAGT